MDEYLDEKGITKWKSPLSFRNYQRKLLWFDWSRTNYVRKSKNLSNSRNGKLIEEIIEKQGVDICFGGVGINGHLAFNEPQENMSVDVFET